MCLNAKQKRPGELSYNRQPMSKTDIRHKKTKEEGTQDTPNPVRQRRQTLLHSQEAPPCSVRGAPEKAALSNQLSRVQTFPNSSDAMDQLPESSLPFPGCYRNRGTWSEGKGLLWPFIAAWTSRKGSKVRDPTQKPK